MYIAKINFLGYVKHNIYALIQKDGLQSVVPAELLTIANNENIKDHSDLTLFSIDNFSVKFNTIKCNKMYPLFYLEQCYQYNDHAYASGYSFADNVCTFVVVPIENVRAIRITELYDGTSTNVKTDMILNPIYCTGYADRIYMGEEIICDGSYNKCNICCNDIANVIITITYGEDKLENRLYVHEALYTLSNAQIKKVNAVLASFYNVEPHMFVQLTDKHELIKL